MKTHPIKILRGLLAVTFVLSLLLNLDCAGMFYAASTYQLYPVVMLNVVVSILLAAVLTTRKNFVYLFGIVLLNILMIWPFFMACT